MNRVDRTKPHDLRGQLPRGIAEHAHVVGTLVERGANGLVRAEPALLELWLGIGVPVELVGGSLTALPGADLAEAAERLEGASGAAIEQVVRDARRIARREPKLFVPWRLGLKPEAGK